MIRFLSALTLCFTFLLLTEQSTGNKVLVNPLVVIKAEKVREGTEITMYYTVKVTVRETVEEIYDRMAQEKI